MYVYRVEHRENLQGPYSWGCGLSDDVRRAPTHPSWYDDHNHENCDWRGGIPCLGSRMFGFISYSQLKDWFGCSTRDCYNLDQQGFHVSVYEVPIEHVSWADKQAVFDRERAVQVGCFPILNLLQEYMAPWQNTLSPGKPQPSDQMDNPMRAPSQMLAYANLVQFAMPDGWPPMENQT